MLASCDDDAVLCVFAGFTSLLLCVSVCVCCGGSSQCRDYMLETTAVPGDRNRCSAWMLAYSDDLLCCVRRTRILLISFFLNQYVCVGACMRV